MDRPDRLVVIVPAPVYAWDMPIVPNPMRTDLEGAELRLLHRLLECVSR